MKAVYGAYLLQKPLYTALDWIFLLGWALFATGAFIYAVVEAFY